MIEEDNAPTTARKMPNTVRLLVKLFFAWAVLTGFDWLQTNGFIAYETYESGQYVHSSCGDRASCARDGDRDSSDRE